MSASTQGLQLRTGSRILGNWVELLSSMRFAISLLAVICIASVIGTVVKQHEPLNNYVNKFGPFWAEVFASAHLFSVYSAWWFILILAFLVASTSLCIARQTPKIFADFRAYKENMREQSLRAFANRAEAALNEAPEQAAQRMGQTLLRSGWRVKLQSRPSAQGTGWMVAAKKGRANKIGYLAAHSAIVLICVGALLDGDLMVRAQTWFNGKQVYAGSGLIANVPAQHRISASNPTFRGNLLVTEGAGADTAILVRPDGVLLQELPFSIELKKFIVEYHASGQPKLFASDIVIHDHDSGAKRSARVEVNHPVSHRGITIYQSSFSDGGSRVKLQALPLSGARAPFEVAGVIGGSAEIGLGSERFTLEFTDLRVLNVENLAAIDGAALAAPAPTDLRRAIESRLGAGNKTVTERHLRNVGPSITYKLRDAAGQAQEFHNYMLPMEVDGLRLFMFGVRDASAEEFRYLRIPADAQDSLDDFVRLRVALADAALREQAVQRFVAVAGQSGGPQMAAALRASAARTLGLFAGAEQVNTSWPRADGQPQPVRGGLPALSVFLEANVPAPERERAGAVLVQVLHGTLYELMQLSRERAALPALPRSEFTQRFMAAAVISLSDSFFYHAPVALQLKDFEHVQASVFQLARAPGQNIVYLGCLLLIIGIFAMLYVRERRVWVWLAPRGEQGAQASLALSTNRKTMESDQEFELLKSQLLHRSAADTIGG